MPGPAYAKAAAGAQARPSRWQFRLILRSIAKRCVSKDEGGLLVRDAPTRSSP